jgi:hydroxyacyl-ACP dehydratase HTD2-like protein with hotdog domain
MSAPVITCPPAEVGDQVVAWTKQPTNLDCFLLGAAYWTSHRIHYDRGWAQEEGYADVVVTGVLLYSWFERLIVSWAGSPSAVTSYSFRHTGVATVQDELIFSGVILDISPVDDAIRVTVAIDVHTIDDRSILKGECRLSFAAT